MNRETLSLPRLGGRELRLVWFALIVLWGIYWMAQQVVRGQHVNLVLAFLLVLQAIFVVFAWRFAVHLFLVYVVLEGFFINYFSGAALMNILKDVQLLAIVLSLLVAMVTRGHFPFPRTWWMPAFVAFSVIYLAGVFNPELPSILVGLVGVRVTLLFVLCFLIAFYYFRHPLDILDFLRLQAWLSVPISLFGVVQYFTGPSLLLSISPGFSRAIIYAHGAPGSGEGYFRTISTFASSAGLSNYLWVTMCLTIAMLWTSCKKGDRLLAAAAIVIQALGMLTTGGRAPFVLTFVSVVLGTLLMRRAGRVMGALALLCLVFMIGFNVLGDPVQNRFSTLLDTEFAMERNIPLLWQLQHAMNAPFAGFGAGRATTGAHRVQPMDAVGYENYLAKIRYEVGWPGLVLFVAWLAILILESSARAFQLRNNPLRAVAGLVVGYILTVLIISPVGMPLDVPPTNIYFWFLLGLLYALLRFDATMSRPAGPAGPSASP